MATRTFPIFRSVQRALGGSAGVGKHKPALAATARIKVEEEEHSDAETEKRSEEPSLPDGHQSGQDKDGVLLFFDKSTWPINSEAARQWRREFARDGFRRLYNVARGQMDAVGAGGGVQNGDENEGDDGQPDGESTQAIGAELNDVVEEDETPPPFNGDDNWVYYAQ